jgi:putative toxin-antitoxin system antitoxin component (TIGR02293 family)
LFAPRKKGHVLPGKNQEPRQYVKHETVERTRYGVVKHTFGHMMTGTAASLHAHMDRKIVEENIQEAFKEIEKSIFEEVRNLEKAQQVSDSFAIAAAIKSIEDSTLSVSRLYQLPQDTLRQIHGSATHTAYSRAAPRISELDALDLANAAIAGLPISTLSQVQEIGYTTQETFELIFLGGFASSPDLSLDESDRVIRLIRIAARAEEVFGNSEKAWRWLRKPKKAFNGKTCVEMLITEYGGREVENMLTRIEHGMAA